ncbi:E3 ubiquitin-protein ligase dbl4 [Grifola frondosa]|uniref:E3 ubiquitin-protein ligase dbl4 n=1 Tax=Grifola frondosa TaxID=5627 RepID=A0A1C7MF62_GRIFR|nr:E3 ubiquitin-protein ligase dbl4 [Grifola frondosa]
MSDYSDVPSDSYDSDGSILEVRRVSQTDLIPPPDLPSTQGDDSDFEVPASKGKGKKKSQGVEYESLSVDRLRDLVDKDIRHVASIVGLDAPIVSILLQHFSWNRDRLLEEYMDSPASILRDAGEPDRAPDSPSQSPRPRPCKRARLSTPPDDPATCGICFDAECPRSSTCAAAMHSARRAGRCTRPRRSRTRASASSAACRTGALPPSTSPRSRASSHHPATNGAPYCLPTSRVSPRAHRLQLPRAAAAVVRRRAPGPTLLPSPILHGDGVVPDGRRLGPAYGGAHGDVWRGACVLLRVRARLGSPAADLQVREAVAEERARGRGNVTVDQGEHADVPEVPEQHREERRVQPNSLPQCSYQFCWLCMKNWDVHGYNDKVCNAWKEPEPDDAKTEAKQNLDKWLFYFDRFNNHEISARSIRSCVSAQMRKWWRFRRRARCRIEAKFMQNAVEELTKCRVTLKWSYAMAYCLAQGNQKQIFEDIQADLEKASLRQRMLDKTVYVRGRHEIVLQDTAEGLAEGRWEWTMPLE